MVQYVFVWSYKLSYRTEGDTVPGTMELGSQCKRANKAGGTELEMDGIETEGENE